MVVDSLLILKIATSIGMVLALSYVAERAGSKWAGIFSGLPTGSAITLYFYAVENGVEFAGESALYNMIGLVAMQAFVFGYYFSSRIFLQAGIFISTLFGLLFYIISSLCISIIPINPILAFFISIGSFFIFNNLFREIVVTNVDKKHRLTVSALFLRAAMSGSIIVTITALAYLVGSKWSGIFSAFPTTLYPLLVIIHLQYGKEHAISIIKHVPHGLAGLLLYSLIIHISYKHMGMYSGILLALLAALAYIGIFKILDR